jgi:hypothetical protein
MRFPNGREQRFSGCYRCREIIDLRKDDEVPYMERTALFSQFAQVEKEFRGDTPHLYPKVKLTIAEMLVKGPPEELL